MVISQQRIYVVYIRQRILILLCYRIVLRYENIVDLSRRKMHGNVDPKLASSYLPVRALLPFTH